MNFLAHVYLSGNDPHLALGNLIADRIKGKDYINYPIPIQKGILLHREIDRFTDQHPCFKACVSQLFPKYRHYSRVIVDMYFDHFLAKNWNQFHPTPLPDFTNDFYAFCKSNCIDFPPPLQGFISALTQYDWFHLYGSRSGLERILKQMEKRTAFPSNLSASVLDLKENYEYFSIHFFEFIKDIQIFTQNKINAL